MQGQKGQGMETKPPHAIKTKVSVARCSFYMLINIMFHCPKTVRFA